jgi:cellulose biosynthesis protein BcsQ
VKRLKHILIRAGNKMTPPKVITIYSRTPGCGKKTIALNAFLAYAHSKPGLRILIVDFSRTEKLRYALLKYGKSQFTSMEFLSEISEDILVNEAVTIFEDKDEN